MIYSEAIALLIILALSEVFSLIIRSFLESKRTNNQLKKVAFSEIRSLVNLLRNNKAVNFIFHASLLLCVLLFATTLDNKSNLDLGLLSLIYITPLALNFDSLRIGNKKSLLIRQALFSVAIIVCLALYRAELHDFSSCWLVITFLLMVLQGKDSNRSSVWEIEVNTKLVTDRILGLVALWFCLLVIKDFLAFNNVYVEYLLVLGFYCAYSFLQQFFLTWKIVRSPRMGF